MIIYGDYMKQIIVTSIEQWNKLKVEIKEKGYYLWQWQYNWNDKEGFHANFYNGRHDVELITHLKEVQKDMINSKMYKKPPQE